MINSDKPNFASMLTATLEIYNVKVNPMVISIWWKTLERFEFLVVEQAFTAHVTDTDVGHFSPKPASILQNIEGSRETRAMMAWAKVEKAVRRIGAGDTVVPMFITLFALWGVRIPLSYFFSLQYDYVGIWWGIPAGWFVGMVLSSSYFILGRWKKQNIMG